LEKNNNVQIKISSSVNDSNVKIKTSPSFNENNALKQLHSTEKTPVQRQTSFYTTTTNHTSQTPSSENIIPNQPITSFNAENASHSNS
jgi:hypothetical protein